tara:strand:+ start:1049 stop:1942 length:894 start_codon:yes stop_codon:yes gene_type:complete
MGIHNREYLRDEPDYGGPTVGGFGGGGSRRGPASAVKILLVLNIAVFLLTVLSEPLREWLHLPPLSADNAWQLPWRVISYGFCHDTTDLFHLVFNMMCLWVFGQMVEMVYQRREFLAIFLAGLVASGTAHLVWQALRSVEDQGASLVGASGGVMAIMVLAACHMPRTQVLLMMVFPIQVRTLVILLVGFDVAKLLGVFGGESNVAHMAHLGGAAWGFLYFRSGWRLSSHWGGWGERFRSWRRRAARPSIRIHQPSVDGLDDQVDAILDKINREGEASLTDRERATLMEASRRKRQES